MTCEHRETVSQLLLPQVPLRRLGILDTSGQTQAFGYSSHNKI